VEGLLQAVRAGVILITMGTWIFWQVDGYTVAPERILVYKNNGNGTIIPHKSTWTARRGGLWTSSVGWGDYDNDGDLDILASGQQTSGFTRELRIYKNNGNGTIDATQIEVDGSGNGLSSGGDGMGRF
jgi:hypothetical protein